MCARNHTAQSLLLLCAAGAASWTDEKAMTGISASLFPALPSQTLLPVIQSQWGLSLPRARDLRGGGGGFSTVGRDPTSNGKCVGGKKRLSPKADTFIRYAVKEDADDSELVNPNKHLHLSGVCMETLRLQRVCQWATYFFNRTSLSGRGGGIWGTQTRRSQHRTFTHHFIHLKVCLMPALKWANFLWSLLTDWMSARRQTGPEGRVEWDKLGLFWRPEHKCGVLRRSPGLRWVAIIGKQPCAQESRLCLYVWLWVMPHCEIIISPSQ